MNQGIIALVSGFSYNQNRLQYFNFPYINKIDPASHYTTKNKQRQYLYGAIKRYPLI